MKHINKILCLLLFVAFSLSAMAQQLNISGTVVDENNEPVPGAGVVVKGTTTGAMTDVNGSYSIQAPADGTLVISAIGLAEKEEAIGGRTRIDVQVSAETNQLDEVVVVGYGAQKRAHLTGSVATIAPTEISDLVGTDLSSSLEGQVAGVSVNSNSNRPGETSRIVIRGEGSDGLLSDDFRAPLYVIDGFISNASTFNNLDPQTVENISILKDASAAVYGARAAQGVVLVTTKRGQAGKPKISYSGNFGFTDEYSRTQFMDAYSYGVAWNAMKAADPMSTWDPLRDLFQYDELQAMKGLNYNPLDKYWTGALTQRHSVTVSGGGENATFFGGLGYNTQDGNLGRIEYNRWNYRAGMDAKINKWAKASLQVSGTYGFQQKSVSKVGGNGDERDYAMLLTMPRYIPEYITDPATGLEYPVAPYGISGSNKNAAQDTHYSMIENNGDFTQNMPQDMTINSALELDLGFIKPLEGLKLRGTYSKSISTTKNNAYQSQYTLYRFQSAMRGGSGNHLYMDTDENAVNFSGMTAFEVDNGNRLERSMSRSDSYQLNFILSYARVFAEKHDVSGLFTIEKAENEREDVMAFRTKPYSFTNFQSNSTPNPETVSDFGNSFGRSEAGNLSYVGRINYAYDDKYLAEFLIRVDASTKFAPENYWGAFPSMSLGWVTSKESWFEDNVSFIDFFKVRGSFGLVGRDAINAWEWMQSYGYRNHDGPIFGESPEKGTGSVFQLNDPVPNRGAHWDKVYKSNIGLDMNFLKSRLSATVEGFYNWQRDVFTNPSSMESDGISFPFTVGSRAAKYNYGAIDDWGMEFSLSWRDRIGKDFKYSVRLTTGWSDNKLIKWKFKEPNERGFEDPVPGERSDRGDWGLESLGIFHNYQEIAEYFAQYNIKQYMGLTQPEVHPGMLIYRDVRGSRKDDGTYYGLNDPNDPVYAAAGGNVVDENMDQIKISNRSNNIYGFTMNLGCEYKNFSLSTQIAASWGSYTYMPGRAVRITDVASSASGMDALEFVNLPSIYAGNMFVYEDILDNRGRVVAAQNREALYPNMRHNLNGLESTFWKENAANIFVRNLTLAYTLPKAWANKVMMESLRVNVTAQNLFELYNPYPDKFTSVNGTYAKYPLLRKITVGLNISF